MKRPCELDGAKVLLYVDAQGEDFGLSNVPDGIDRVIKHLAIAQYADHKGVYLFSCDENWKVLGDLFYDSIDEAKEDAERFYKTGRLVWIMA